MAAAQLHLNDNTKINYRRVNEAAGLLIQPLRKHLLRKLPLWKPSIFASLLCLKLQMDRPKPKRNYYIPGIISLIILPIAFCFYAKREMRQSTVWAMPLIWVDTTHLKRLAKLDTNLVEKFPPKRNFLTIAFTGSPIGDRTKLAYSEIRIKEILNGGDTLNGIHFLFGDSSSYGTVVGVFDKLQTTGAKKYVTGEKDIWFWHIPPDTVKLLEYDCLLCNDIIFVEPEISWWTKTKESVSHIWETSWQLILLYCSFVVSVVVLRRKANGS